VDPAKLHRLKSAIRDVPDFPKEGILFKDITPVLADPELFQTAIQAMVEPYRDLHIDKVVGIDARGFIFAGAGALALNAGFVPVRKKGKLPWKSHCLSYTLEYGEAEVEMHIDAILEGERVLLMDDLLATGGTAAAAQRLIEKIGGELIGSMFMIELEALQGRSKLSPDSPVSSIVRF